MSHDAPAANESPSSQSCKPRNPVERVIVWGLIAALVLVVAMEARARFAYAQSVSRLQAAMAEAESLDSSNFLIENVPAMLSGNPSVASESRRFDQVNHYEWNGLFRKYGLHVSYGTYTRIVTGMASDEAPPAPEIRQLAADPNAEPAEHGGGGQPGGGGGSGPRPDPMQADADGDGKLSREEAPGRMAEFFDRIDADSDGFITPAELEARRSQRAGASGRSGVANRGEHSSDAGDRQRPPLDEPAQDSLTPTGDPAAASPQTPSSDAAAVQQPESGDPPQP